MQLRTRFGISIAALGILIAFLQLLAATYYLYWEFWWYDIMMHLLGGLFIGLSFLWVLYFEVPHIKNRIPVFATTFFVVLVVGIAWEVFEYVTGMYNAKNYNIDTTLDLAMDMVGMMGAYLLFKRI